MSLATEVFKTQYNTNGVTTAFAIDFTTQNEQDVLVTVLLDTDTLEVEQVLTTEYTINAGRTSVEMLTAPADGKLTVSRNNRKIQNFSWPVGGPFSEESLNDGLDFRAMTNFEVFERLGRALRAQINDTEVEMRLPLKAARASKFLAFDADSIPIASGGVSDVPVSSFWEGIVDDASAGPSLTTLGFSAFIQTLIDDVNSATARATLEIREVPEGTIQAFGGTSAPTGTLLCDGSAVSRTTYADLFTAISTAWGVGDGSTTFNVPDLRGAFVRGTGSNGTGNMADGNDFAGPAVAAFENDQMFGHWHDLQTNTSGTGGRPLNGGSGGVTVSNAVDNPISDTVNGTPRSGDETRPFNAGVTYVIKY